MRGKTPPDEPLSLGERRKMLIVAGLFSVALITALVSWQIWGHSNISSSSGDGCVSVNSASSMGGGFQHACGRAARTWCDAAYQQTDALNLEVQRQCGVAGLPRAP